MESTKENSLSFPVKWSHAGRFGILAGLLTVGVTLMGYLFAGDSVSFQQQGFFTMGSIILVMILAVQAVKSYRNEELNGTVTVRKCDDQKTLSIDSFIDEVLKEIIK